MTTLSGREFNCKYPVTEFYKVLNSNSIHYDFQYKHGLNIDTVPFYPKKSCSSGGLYFTELEKLPLWIHLGSHIGKITIPDDAIVFAEKDKFKADRVELDLDNKVLTEDFYIWGNESLCLNAIHRFGGALQYVRMSDQSNKICKLAVQSSGYYVKYVKNQTEDICKLAVQQVPEALLYVRDQTEEICKMAVQMDGHTLLHVKNQTDEICLLAVEQKGSALQYVNVQTPNLCRLAVIQNGCNLQFVKTQTEEICELAVLQNAHALKFVNAEIIDIWAKML